MSSFPQCSVCEYIFKYQERQPYLLPCLHAACEECIKKISHSKITCKVCIIIFNSRKFPVDTVRVRKIFHLTCEHHPSELFCTNKPDGNQAVAWCRECITLFCKYCQDVHGGLKAIREHSVKGISNLTTHDIQRVETFCVTHKNYIADEYDDTCQQLVCSRCKKSPEHREHMMEDIETYMASQKQELETKYSTLVEHRDNLASTCLQTLRRLTEELKRCADTELQEVSKTFTDIKTSRGQYLNQISQEASLSQVAQHITNQKSSAIKVQKRLQSVLDYITMTLQYATACDLIVLSKIILSASVICLQLRIPQVCENQTYLRASLGNRGKLTSVVSESTSDEEKEPEVKDETSVPDATSDTQNESEISQVPETITITKDLTRHPLRENQQLGAEHAASADAVPYLLVKAGPDDAVVIKCPKLEFGQDFVNHRYSSVINDELVNTKVEQLSQDSSRRLRHYKGTTTSQALITSHSSPCMDLLGIIYFEVRGHMCIVQRVRDEWFFNLVILEIGFCGAEQMDKTSVVCGKSGSWGLCIGYCRQENSICTQIWKGEKKEKCQPDTISCTSVGANLEVSYGIAIDAGKGRVAFLDLQSHSIFHEMELDIGDTVWPMFAVASHAECIQVKMKLVSEHCLSMSEPKKELILQSMHM